MPQHSRNKETERRSGIDRRQFSYAVHIPERRKNGERRRSRRKPMKRLQDSVPVVTPFSWDSTLLGE